MHNILFRKLPLFGLMLFMSTKTTILAPPARPTLYHKSEINSCGPSTADVLADDRGKFISILPGWGSHGYKISTRNDSTQLYFNQGLNFYYSYHFREALASFREAARFDANCAMAYWGQALSMGPYYNAYYYKMNKEVPGVIKYMVRHISNTGEKELALIKAMQQRYSSDSTNADRHQLDSSYAAAMSLLTITYAGDLDIKSLYVDAVMLHHKWDFWNNNGTPKPWTPELVKICEENIKNDTSHPASLHYYIHLTEASRHPEMALRSADLLKDQMPGVGHMVHMATHMYQRNGLFEKGVDVNEDANNVNNRIDSLAPNLGIGKNTGLHIYSVQSYCAMNAGMYRKGMPVYLRTRSRLLELRPAIRQDAYSQYLYMMPVMAWVRLGKWQQILASPSPDPMWKYALVLHNFAKGMAFVHMKNFTAARLCLDSLEENLADSLLAVREMPFNKPVQCGKIAASILKGRLSQEEGKTTEALAAFNNAVSEEDNLIYREPKDWLIPARQYLGAFLLATHHAQAAEKVYREDLVHNPGNGWSLLGMYQSLLVQHKKVEAAAYRKSYLKAFRAADVIPPASVF